MVTTHSVKRPSSQSGLICGKQLFTWRLSRAGLQGARLLRHRLGEGVAASDQLPALVTLHISHPHAHAARLGALRGTRAHKLNTRSGETGTWSEPPDLTSDQGVVYHLKHGLSKQVVSPSGLVKLPPHASSSNIWNFPPLMPTHRTTRRFTPRPQVVLHCTQDMFCDTLLLTRNQTGVSAPRLYIEVKTNNRNRRYPLPVLAQPGRSTVSPPTGVDGQGFVLNRTLVVRNNAALWSLTVHMTHHLSLATRPRALQQHRSKVKLRAFTWDLTWLGESLFLPGKSENLKDWDWTLFLIIQPPVSMSQISSIKVT